MTYPLIALVLLASTRVAFAADAAVRHYDLDVQVRSDGIAVRTTLALGEHSGPLELSLSPEMRVVSVESKGSAVEFTRDGARLVVDLSSSASEVAIAVDGTPHNAFSEERGGFVRTDVGAEIAYIRSQYDWYPRVDGEPATYRTVVHARSDWLVRTAGEQERTGDGVWTFVQATPTRNIGLVAGPYVTRELKTPNGFVLDALAMAGDEEGADRLLTTARSALDHYSARFGAVNVKRFTIVEMPEAFGSGSGYGEDGYILVGKGAFGGAAWARSLVAHEVAHTWWGREVSFRDFASESLASYATLGWIAATDGEVAAVRERRAAVEAICSAADAGREVALSDITGFGGGMDPRTYRVHAYEKGMMLLSMAEDALGREQMEKLLAKFVTAHRGDEVGWADLRKALATGDAKPVVEQWEQPGVPTLKLVKEGAKKGKRWAIKGSVAQEGTETPFRMVVQVVAVRGEERDVDDVKLTGRQTSFSLTVDGEPDSVVLDPNWRLVVRAPRGGAVDPAKVIEEAAAVFNSPDERDRERNEATIAKLEHLLQEGAGSYEGLCHTGIGRCLFRLRRYDEAREHFSKALELGPGGPFHARWIHLRLGCMADAEGHRDAAIEQYRKVLQSSEKGHTSDLARRYIDEPYREP